MYVHGVEMNIEYDVIPIIESGIDLISARNFLDSSATKSPVNEITEVVNTGPIKNKPFVPKIYLITAK